MYILFGILGCALAVLEEFLGGRYLDFTLSRISFSVVIPFGVILIGGFVGFIIGRGRILENKKMKRSQYIFAIIIGIATFFSINYMEYKTTYLSDSYQFVRADNGNPVSACTYIDDDGSEKSMTFVNYEKYILDNCDSVIDGKYLKNEEVSTHGVINYIRYFIKLLGLIIGALFGVILSNKNDIYCDQCSRYKKEKVLFKFSRGNYDFVMRILNETENWQIEFDNLIKSKWKKDKNTEYYQAVLVYCSSCRSAEIYVEEMKAKNNTEVIQHRKIIGVSDFQLVEKFI